MISSARPINFSENVTRRPLHEYVSEILSVSILNSDKSFLRCLGEICRVSDADSGVSGGY